MAPADSTLAVRVLTVASARERQERMHGVLGGAMGLRGVDWRLVHAVTPEAAGLAYDERAVHAAQGRTLSPAELSCFASHVEIIRAWRAEAASDVLLVLEDDVYLDPWYDFAAAARLALAGGLDYLRLYARAAMPARPVAYNGRTQVVRFTWSPSGTQAYMLTRAGADRILAAVDALGRIERPIDDLIDRYWEVGNPTYGLFPSPVVEHNMPTMVHRPEQLRARLERQAALDAARPAGLPARLQAKGAALRDRLARRRAERELRRGEAEVARRVSAHMEAPGFRHLSVDLAALAAP